MCIRDRIKLHRPRYNTLLKDDTAYPYLRISLQEEFPGLSVVRRPQLDGNLYLGPFASPRSLRESLKTLTRAFPLRRCRELRPRERPCLNGQMGRCLAPCTGGVDPERYRRLVEELRRALEGGGHGLIQELEQQMQRAAARMEFEEAARLRDRIRYLQRFLRSQRTPPLGQLGMRADLEELRRALGMARPPRIIDGMDASQLGGRQTVASRVRFLEGEPLREGYRRFRLPPVNDDCRLLAEAVRRSLSEGEPPDLLVLDGGRGQLSTVLAAIEQLELRLEVVAFAKGSELIHRPGKPPLSLPAGSSALLLLQRGRPQEALADLRRALPEPLWPPDADPSFPALSEEERLTRLRDFLEQEGVVAEALRWCQRLPQRGDLAALRVRGYLHWLLGNWRAAIECLERVRGLRGAAFALHYELGVAYFALGRYEEAVRLLRRSNRYGAHLRLALYWRYVRRDYRRALAEIQRALRRRPGSPEALKQRRELLRMLGRGAASL
mgnify:CR=1 FL=1